jgi:hypothetical protein
LMGFLGFGEKGGGLSSAFKDMKDGGGRGGSGNSYSRLSNAEYQRIGGGAAVAGERPQGYTSIGNDGNRVRTGFGGYGYEDPLTKQWVPFGVDAINGGGAGMAGNRFKGPFAITGLLNMLGVRPMGYADRVAAASQAQAPQAQAPQQTAPEYSTNGQSAYTGANMNDQNFAMPDWMNPYLPENKITQTALGPNNMPMPEYLRSLSGRVNRAVASPNRGRYGSM